MNVILYYYYYNIVFDDVESKIPTINNEHSVKSEEKYTHFINNDVCVHETENSVCRPNAYIFI